MLYQATAEWDVPLMVTRGYPSLSYLYTPAEAMQAEQRPCHLYYFGDLDPSGVDIPRKVEHDLREFAPDVDLTFKRVAVTRDQVEEMGLQTRPTKTTDTRAKYFRGESVEVDAIPPATLRRMVSDLIEQHIDGEALSRLKTVVAPDGRPEALDRLDADFLARGQVRRVPAAEAALRVNPHLNDLVRHLGSGV